MACFCVFGSTRSLRKRASNTQLGIYEIASSEAVLVRPDAPVESADLQGFLEIEASDCPLRSGAYQPGCSKSIRADLDGWPAHCPRRGLGGTLIGC